MKHYFVYYQLRKKYFQLNNGILSMMTSFPTLNMLNCEIKVCFKVDENED